MAIRLNLTAPTSICAALVLSLSLAAQGQEPKANWNRFRGPNGQGIAATARIPIHFGPDSNVLWQTPVPPGKSSPVIWDNRIFLTAYGRTDKQTLITLAVDREHARRLWRQVVETDRKARAHPMNGPAAPTPAADEKHVYACSGTYGLLCYNHKGDKVWQRELKTPTTHFGVAISPIPHGDKVIMVLDDNKGASRVLVVPRDTAETAWEQPSPFLRAGSTSFGTAACSPAWRAPPARNSSGNGSGRSGISTPLGDEAGGTLP